MLELRKRVMVKFVCGEGSVSVGVGETAEERLCLVLVGELSLFW